MGTPGYLISILNSLSMLSHYHFGSSKRSTLASSAIKKTIMTKIVIALSITVGAGGISLLVTLF